MALDPKRQGTNGSHEVTCRRSTCRVIYTQEHSYIHNKRFIEKIIF